MKKLTIKEQIEQCEQIIESLEKKGLCIKDIVKHKCWKCIFLINDCGFNISLRLEKVKQKLEELYKHAIRKNGSRTNISIKAVKGLKELTDECHGLKVYPLPEGEMNLRKRAVSIENDIIEINNKISNINDKIKEIKPFVEKLKKEEIPIVVGGVYRNTNDDFFDRIIFYNDVENWYCLMSRSCKIVKTDESKNIFTEAELISYFKRKHYKYTGKTLEGLLNEK